MFAQRSSWRLVSRKNLRNLCAAQRTCGDINRILLFSVDIELLVGDIDGDIFCDRNSVASDESFTDACDDVLAKDARDGVGDINNGDADGDQTDAASNMSFTDPCDDVLLSN